MVWIVLTLKIGYFKARLDQFSALVVKNPMPRSHIQNTVFNDTVNPVEAVTHIDETNVLKQMVS